MAIDAEHPIDVLRDLAGDIEQHAGDLVELGAPFRLEHGLPGVEEHLGLQHETVADNPEGRAELDKIAAVLLDVTRQIPQDIAWVLRVDGHTDVRPVGGNRTNWDLSAARAIAVVQYLISKGLPPQRLVAAGFGEFQPIDPGTTEESYSRNRRIELKLTER